MRQFGCTDGPGGGDTVSDAAAAATPAPEAAPPETEPEKSARELILSELLDCVEAGPLSRQQLLEATNLDLNVLDQALFRAKKAGQIECLDRGLYRLATTVKPSPPPKPKLPPKPPPPTVSSDGRPVQQWLDWLSSWYVGAAWQGHGSAPDQPGHQIPIDVVYLWNARKAELKRAAAEKAAAEKAAAAPPPKAAAKPAPPRKAAAAAEDAALLDKLLAATNGNFVDGTDLGDVGPIKAALEVAPLEHVLSVVRSKADRRIFPKNPPLRSWGDPALLKAIAESFCKSVVRPHRKVHRRSHRRACAYRLARITLPPPRLRSPLASRGITRRAANRRLLLRSWRNDDGRVAQLTSISTRSLPRFAEPGAPSTRRSIMSRRMSGRGGSGAA
jgi:hypothetical protein